MANPLFNQGKQNKDNPIARLSNSLKKLGPSEAVYNQWYNNNTEFREFADTVRNMGPNEAFKQKGLDFSQFEPYKW